MLNFKSCIMIMLKKMGYEDIKRTDNVRDPIDASRSYTYDLVASKNGEKIFVRCFHTINGELTVGHINVLWQEAHKNGNAKAIFATNYKSKDIPNEINDFATSYNVEIWDMSKLLEITNEYFLKNLKEPPVTLPSGFEHKLLQGMPQEPRIFNAVKNTVPTVANVVLTEGGCCWLHAAVSVKKQTEGDGKNIIMAALAAHPSLKHVVVVDEDVNIFDPQDIEYAIATRVKGDDDIIIVPKARGSSLDPKASEIDGTTTKVGVDATKSILEPEKFERVSFSE